MYVCGPRNVAIKCSSQTDRKSNSSLLQVFTLTSTRTSVPVDRFLDTFSQQLTAFADPGKEDPFHFLHNKKTLATKYFLKSNFPLVSECGMPKRL